MLTEQQLMKLTTQRLLAYLRSWHKYHDTPNWDNDQEFCKQSPMWQEHYKLIKSILKEREHIK